MDEKTETILLYHWLGVLNEGSHWQVICSLKFEYSNRDRSHANGSATLPMRM